MIEKKYVLLMLSLFLLSFVNAGLYYDVALNYDNGEIEVVGVDVIYSKFEKSNFYSENSSEKYVVSLLNDVKKIIYFEEASIPNIQIVDYLDRDSGEIGEGEVVVLENVSFNLYLPYYENINLIVVESVDNEVIEEVDVRTYATVQGDLESDDVKAGMGDGVLDEKKENNLVYLILGIIIVLVISFGVAFFLGKKDDKTKGFIKK